MQHLLPNYALYLHPYTCVFYIFLTANKNHCLKRHVLFSFYNGHRPCSLWFRNWGRTYNQFKSTSFLKNPLVTQADPKQVSL